MDAHAAALEPAIGRRGDTTLPARFDAGRIFVHPVTHDGQVLTFLADTGGASWVSSDAVARLRLSPAVERGSDTPLVTLPSWKPGAAIPCPRGLPTGIPIFSSAELFGEDSSWTGMLGAAWFADRIWTLDYGRGSLTLHERAPEPVTSAATIPLGFRDATAPAHRRPNFPRVTVVIGDDTLELLLDTGASVDRASSANETRPPSGARVAGSFISRSRFENWKAAHGSWRVIRNAEPVTGADMIEAPRVSIGGLEFGPVWFTSRPDATFHRWMSQWMDREIDGALGGSALRHLRVTLDYVHRQATIGPADTT